MKLLDDSDQFLSTYRLFHGLFSVVRGDCQPGGTVTIGSWQWLVDDGKHVT